MCVDFLLGKGLLLTPPGAWAVRNSTEWKGWSRMKVRVVLGFLALLSLAAFLADGSPWGV